MTAIHANRATAQRVDNGLILSWHEGIVEKREVFRSSGEFIARLCGLLKVFELDQTCPEELQP